MDRTIVQCRRCGRKMRREKTGFEYVQWTCDCGLRERTPVTRRPSGAGPHYGEDVFARIRFDERGDVMFEVPRDQDARFELMSLDEISRLVNAEIPLSEIFAEVTAKIASRMRMEVCSIYRNVGGELILAATHGLAPEAVGKVRLAIGEGITGAAAREKRFIAVADAAADPRYRHFAIAREERYKAMLSYPILDEGRVLGVINVQTVRSRSFSGNEVSYLAVVANLLRACLRMRDRVRDIAIEPPPDGR